MLFNSAGADLVTKNGKTYSDYKVFRVSARGLEVFHSEGACTIPFENLPDEIREQYKVEEERFAKIARKKEILQKKRREQQRIQSAVNLRMRPIRLIPFRKYSGGYLCCWETNDNYYTTYNHAYAEVPITLRREYHRAKQLDDKRKNRSQAEIQREYEQNFVKMNNSGVHPRMANNFALMSATQKNLHQDKWLSRVNEWFASTHPYPKTETIIVFGLPHNTLTDVEISAIIFKTGTFSYNSSVIERYTVNRKEILEQIKQNKYDKK